MFIPITCIILTIVLAYFLWGKAPNNKYKAALVIGVIIIFAISGQYIKLTKDEFLEGFEVQMPDADSYGTDDSDSTTTIKSKPYNDANGYLDEDEENILNNKPATENSQPANKIKTITDLDNLAKSGVSSSVKKSNRKDDKFNNIVQKDTGSEQSSVFNPQIFVLSSGKSAAGYPSTGAGNSLGAQSGGNSYSNNLVGINSSSTNQLASSQVSSTVNNFGVNPRVIDEYLRPRSDIFNNPGGSDSGSANAFEWMRDFITTQNRQSNNSNNNNTASCPVSKPYAEESAGRFNTATLTNRTFVPGMAYIPPAEWDVPQVHNNSCRQVCNNIDVNTRALPIGIMDHGTPVFALEIGNDGTIAKTEQEVQYTNIGSIMPKFEYREYIDCPGPRPTATASSAATTTTSYSTTTTNAGST